MPRAELVELRLGGPAAPWRATLGVGDGDVVGGVALRFEPAAPPGLAGLALRGLRTPAPDGLPLHEQPGVRPPVAGATAVRAVDHVVAVTDDLARTADRLVAAGLDLRRRDARAAFFVLGPALLELVERAEAPPGRAALWGVTFVVDDVDVARAHVGPAKAAVQPGRRIATVRAEAGLGLPVALITPRG